MNFQKFSIIVIKFLFIIVLNSTIMGRGSILVMGGGNDRKSWADEPFIWFVQQADSGKIINIDVDDVATSYAETFISFGADPSSTSIRIQTTAEANDSTIYNQLLTASGIWIEGGDQYDYVRVWEGTLIEEAIQKVFDRGGAVGGTSAGCAVMGMVDFDARYGTSHPEDAAYNPYHTDVHLSDHFLPLIPDAITDSHFHSRGRLGRLIPMLARRIQDHSEKNIIGIGVADNTALCIESDTTAMCYGEGTVTILYKTDESEIECTAHKPVHFTHIAFDQLIHGTLYDLRNRTLITPGQGLISVSDTLPEPQLRKVILKGSEAATADSGEIVITELTGNELNAWYGNLGQREGTKTVPQTVIIPKLWQNNDYFENRLIGGMYGIATHPGFMALYLDVNSEVIINSEGWLKVKGLTYILDSHTVTHMGFAKGQNSNYPGIIGGKLHFLSDGDSIQIAHIQTNIFDDKSHYPHTIKLFPSFPNPFNSSTMFKYSVHTPGFIKIDVYNIKGELVDQLGKEYVESGIHEEKWKPDRLASGIYILKLIQKDNSAIQTCLYLR
ncbi:MAG: Type 1 glutamine amidotransferase-like domain-containing protein [bacterium]